MKQIKGKLLITFTMIITIIIWLTAVPMESLTVQDKIRHILAGVALNGLFLVFLLSTRNKTMERWFNGLDKVYQYHKFLAIFSVTALLIHSMLSEFIKTQGKQNIGSELAGLALFIFIVISVISMLPNSTLLKFTKKLMKENVGGKLAGLVSFIFKIVDVIIMFIEKLKYETWRLIHRLMLVAYLFGLAHTYLSSKYNLLQFNPLGIWTGITSVVGIISGIYIVFLYQRLGFKYRGIVTNIIKLSSNISEIEISLDRNLDYKKGQYVFVKVFQNGIENAPHPFSISGGKGMKIYLTIKNSGDYTKQINNDLELNTKISLDGPYGNMNFNKGNKNQIWIAGGIGITPFISCLKDNNIKDKSIEMFYSYRGETSAVYKEFLEQYQEDNEHIKINFIDSTTMAHLNFDNYALKEDTSIFMCGPSKMMDGFAKTFKINNKNADIVYEGFNFR